MNLGNLGLEPGLRLTFLPERAKPSLQPENAEYSKKLGGSFPGSISQLRSNIMDNLSIPVWNILCRSQGMYQLWPLCWHE